MNKLRKIAALVVTAALAAMICIMPASAVSILPLYAPGDSIAASKTIKSGGLYTENLLIDNAFLVTTSSGITDNTIERYGISSIDQKYVSSQIVKCNVGKKGKLSLTFDTKMQYFEVQVYDSECNYIEPASISAAQGSYDASTNIFKWGLQLKASNGRADYDVEEGTYYIRFIRAGYAVSSQYSFKATFPQGNASVSSPKAAKSSGTNLILYMEPKDKVNIGALVNGKESSVTWTTSDKKVATVNAMGKVTAVKSGTADITGKSGSNVVTVTIIVE